MKVVVVLGRVGVEPDGAGMPYISCGSLSGQERRNAAGAVLHKRGVWLWATSEDPGWDGGCIEGQGRRVRLVTGLSEAMERSVEKL